MKPGISKNGAKYMMITHYETFFANKIEHFRKYHLDAMNPKNQHHFRYSALYTSRDGCIVRIKRNGAEWTK